MKTDRPSQGLDCVSCYSAHPMKARLLLVLLSAAVLMLAACGGKGAQAGGADKTDLDADPYALLPSSAIVVAHLDARAMFESASVGDSTKALAERFVPIGEEAGFDAVRDVDRVVVAAYAMSGADVAAVLQGRFDPDKIAAASTAKNGAPLVKGKYADRATIAAGAIAFAVLTNKTIVAGTSDGLRRVLERIHDGKIERSIPPWMIDTLTAPGAELAIAGDFGSQPIAAASIGSVKLPWLEGIRAVRVIGNFDRPGMNVAATLTYGGAQQAQGAADGVRLVDRWLTVLGPMLGGLELRNLDVKTEEGDMKCKFALDEHALKALVGLAARWVPAAAGASR